MFIIGKSYLTSVMIELTGIEICFSSPQFNSLMNVIKMRLKKSKFDSHDIVIVIYE